MQKYQLIFISHNKLAAGVKTALEMIAGPQEVSTYGLMPGEKPDDRVKEIEAKMNADTNYLILADLLGGSMANSAVSLISRPNVKMITGLNLALALQAALEKPWTDDQIKKIITSAQKNVQQVKIEQKAENPMEDFF